MCTNWYELHTLNFQRPVLNGVGILGVELWHDGLSNDLLDVGQRCILRKWCAQRDLARRDRCRFKQGCHFSVTNCIGKCMVDTQCSIVFYTAVFLDSPLALLWHSVLRQVRLWLIMLILNISSIHTLTRSLSIKKTKIHKFSHVPRTLFTDMHMITLLQ